jgi:hypothetical protein
LHVRIGRENSLYQTALVGLAGNKCGGRPGCITLIQAEFRFASGAIGPMASEAVLRKNRSYVAVVLNRLLALRKRRDSQDKQKRKMGGASHRVLRITA